MINDESIIISSALKSTTTRGGSLGKVSTKKLAENINTFMSQIDTLLEKTPENIGMFDFKEFTVTAEITVDGKLSLLGSGVGIAGKGGITFKFERNRTN